MRTLLLKSAVLALFTVTVIWEVSDLFYGSDEDYWRADAVGMCDAWLDLVPAVRASGLDGFPKARPDRKKALSRDCGRGLRVRSGKHEFEALLSGPGGERKIADAEIPWVEEDGNDRLLWWFSVVFAGFAALAVTWPLVGRATELESVARAIAAGDLDARADAAGPAELGSLARSINTMADRVTAHIRARRVMLQAVAHEMGQPLTRMRFALELLADAEDDGGRTRQMNRLEAGFTQLERLSEGVARQLGNEMAVRKARTRHADLAPLIAAVVQATPTGEITVETELDSVTASVDADLLEIATRNLVDNALRFASTKVLVSLRREAEVVTLMVDDDGPGVAEDQREAVLRPFVQGQGGGALGLGLAMVTDIARVHGGDVVIETSPLGGARFRLFFPTDR